MKLIESKDLEGLSFLFKGKRGQRRAEFIMRFLALDKVNWVYEHSESYTGADFTSRLLDDLGVNYRVGNVGRLKLLPKGAFITISNHPYGGLDGIMSIDLIARIRPDYKFMVNKFLAMIKTMSDNFIAVTPSFNNKTSITAASISGIRQTIKHLRDGHPAGFFPSGAVSDFSLKNFTVRDRKWQEGILNVIHKAKVPILPIRFFDKNSAFFYFLGLIHWKIRSLRLPSEVFNKNGQEPRIGIGNIIPVGEQERFTDTRSFGFFLRKVVYEMPLPTSFVSRKMIKLNDY